MTDGNAAPSAPPASSPHERLWLDIRAGYLAGCSAPVLAERHRVPVRTIRRRAAIEGWRRADQVEDAILRPWPDREAEIEETPELVEAAAMRSAETFALLFSPTAEEMRAVAFRRSAEAAAMDRPAEAVVWMRLVQQLERAGDRIDAERRAFSTTDHLRAAFIEGMRGDLEDARDADELDLPPAGRSRE